MSKSRRRPAGPLTFPQRPKIVEGACGKWRVWHSKCRRYKVAESRVNGLGARVYAQRWDANGGCWDIIRTHRHVLCAMETCQREARYTRFIMDDCHVANGIT